MKVVLSGGHSREAAAASQSSEKEPSSSVHRLEDLPRSCPHPQLSPRQHWWQSLPLPPTHLGLHILPVDLFFFPDATADHFSLILPRSQLCWVAGLGHPRDIPLPGYITIKLPCNSLGMAPLIPLAESLGRG